MRSVLTLAVSWMALAAQASVVFTLSSEVDGKGVRKSWVMDRWKCHNLAEDAFDNQASWAYVDNGLANGCELYDEADCKGASYFVEKNNGDILGPGAVNLTNVNFDNIASSFQCL